MRGVVRERAMGDNVASEFGWESNNMSKRILLPILFLTGVAVAQVQPVSATIDAGRTGAPISKYVYGQFIEHIAGTINSGIWAEMLDDRKFYRSEERRVGKEGRS